MTPKRRILLAAILAPSTAIILSSLLGALEAPTGLNIAAAMVIGLALLIEAPLAAMAIAKHEHKTD